MLVFGEYEPSIGMYCTRIHMYNLNVDKLFNFANTLNLELNYRVSGLYVNGCIKYIFKRKSERDDGKTFIHCNLDVHPI